jgi:hypothetical protein
MNVTMVTPEVVDIHRHVFCAQTLATQGIEDSGGQIPENFLEICLEMAAQFDLC